MTSPRFSPIPSDYGSRALSPTLSASSRTTTSLPTDVSDLSSLDGDEDFELIDAPRSDRGEITDGDDNDEDENISHAQDLAESFDDLAYRSSSILSASLISRSSTSQTDGSNNVIYKPSNSNQEEFEGSDLLPSRNSLTPMRHSGLLELSTTSSQLKFPDPLDSSFQQLDLERITSKHCEETPRMEQNVEEEINDMADRATLTDLAEKSMQVEDDHHQDHESDDKSENLPDITPPTTPTLPGPPLGFPFKLDKMKVASNTCRALVTILMVLLASGVMPVWRNGSPLPIVSTPSTLKAASLTNVASPTPFTQLNKSLSIISSKASKGLIAVGMASSFGTQKCSDLAKLSSKNQKGKKKLKKNVPTRYNPLATGSANIQRGAEIAVFQPEPSYSALAAEWLLSTPSKISPIQVPSTKQKDPMFLGIREFDVLSRIDRPSRAAKSLVGNVKKMWPANIEETGGDFIKYMASLAAKESMMVKTETINFLRNLDPKTRQLISSLQKSWDVWMMEVMKAYAKLRIVVQEEMMKVQGDFSRAYRKSDEIVKKFSKHVVERHRALEELTNCQFKLFSLYTRSSKDIDYKEKFKFYMKLQRSAWKSMPKTMSEAKEACNQLKLVAHTYKPSSRSFRKGKRRTNRRDKVASFANSLRKRSNDQVKESIKSIKQARKQAERALRRRL